MDAPHVGNARYVNEAHGNDGENDPVFQFALGTVFYIAKVKLTSALLMILQFGLYFGISGCCFNAFLYAWRSKPLHEAYKKLLC